MLGKRQVIVVGAGPSGSTVAFYLAKAGIDALLVDKETWPRDKPCGDGQGARIFQIYQDMGITEEADRVASGFIKGTKFSGVSEILTKFDSGVGKSGYITQRRVIDDVIRRAAIRAGADWMENFEVTEVIRERGYAKGVRGYYGGKEIEIRSDVVVLADGGHSSLGQPFGIYDVPDQVFIGARGYFENVNGLEEGFLEEHYPAEIYYPGGYMWLFPMGNKKANVGVYILERKLREGNLLLEKYFDWWRDNTKIGQERLGEAKLLGQLKGYRLPTARKVGDFGEAFANGLVAVGDAGGHINFYSGGGFDYGMLSGKAAAETLIEAFAENDFSKGMLKSYQDRDIANNDMLLRLNAAISDNLCRNSTVYDQFLAYARSMPSYPNLNQYQVSIEFMLKILHVDLQKDYGIDLSKMTVSAMSGGH